MGFFSFVLFLFSPESAVHNATVDPGTIDVLENITQDQRNQLKKNLLRSPLELLDDKKAY